MSLQLTITEKAAEELKKAMATEQGTQVAGLRLGMLQGGCCGARYSLSLAETGGQGEASTESQGIKVFVDSTQVETLAGTVIDYVETPMGAGFHVTSPNQETGHGHGDDQGHGHGHGHGGGGCGCGSGGGGCGGNCAC